MQAYGKFRPTEFDTAGLALDDQQGWLVAPVSHNRDSDCLTESNWESQESALEQFDETDVQTHRFGHWACGWFEIVIVRPETEAARIADELESALADYPVLDDETHSRKEYESYCENWESWGQREFVSAVVRKCDLATNESNWLLEEFLSGCASDSLMTWFESLIPSGDYIEDGVPCIRRALHRVTRSGLAEFIWGQRRTRAIKES